MQSYSSDQLSKITDDELIKEYMSVRSKINMGKKNKEDTTSLEVYFCYVSREVQERENRTIKKKKVV